MAIALTAGIASALASGGAILGLTGLAAYTAAFAIGAGLSLVSRALMPKLDLGTQMGGQSVTTRESAQSRKIVYGRARIGGNIAYLESTGDDNKYLYLVIVVAGHEIDAYEEVWFNDEKIWSGNNYVGDWGDYVNIGFFTGDQTEADNSRSNNLVDASDSKWTNDHKLLDIAYMVVRLEHDVDKFAQGLPNISTIIRGKKVYDPDPNVNATAWSQNPALCIYDYLRDTKYGLGETAANILTSSVIAAKDVCNEPVQIKPVADNITQPRYTIDGVVDTANSIKANIETMIGSMAGRLIYSSGKFEVHAGEYIAPSITVDESQIIGEITVQTKQSRRNAFNGVKGVFLSEEDNYILADYPAQISSAYAVQDGDPIYLDMPLPYTSNNIRAQRLAKLALFRSRQQEAITIPCNLSALRFKIGENISVTNTRLGYDEKVFEVVGYAMDFTSDGQIVVNVDAIETASSIWDWQASDEEVFLTAGEVELYSGSVSIAPASITVVAVAYINADGTTNSTFDVTWPASVDAFTDHYIVEWRLASPANQAYFSQNTKLSPFTISNLQNSETYNVSVKAVNELGVASAPVTASPTSVIDTTPPSVPSPVSATGQYQQINVLWVNPTQNDFSHVDVYRATTENGTYSLRGKSAGTSFADTDLAVTTQFFYKVKAVDYTGNASVYSAVVNATTTAEPIDSLVTTTRISSASNTNAPTDSVFSGIVGRNPVDGDIVFATSTAVTPNPQVAYQRDSGSWVAQTNIISGDVITPDTITATKINVTNLAAINADMGTITAGSISVAFLTGDVTEVYPIGIEVNNSMGTSGTTTYQDIWIPAPSLGLSKRQRISADFTFSIQNSSSTNYSAFFQYGLQYKGKTNIGASVGTVTHVSFPASYRQYVSLAGNVLEKIDNVGGVAKTNNGAGTYGVASIVGVSYDADDDKTYVLMANIATTFATGDTLFFSVNRFESAGTFVANYQSLQTKMIFANTTERFSLPLQQYFGSSTTATNVRPYIIASTNMNNLTGTFSTVKGTMENIA